MSLRVSRNALQRAYRSSVAGGNTCRLGPLVAARHPTPRLLSTTSTRRDVPTWPAPPMPQPPVGPSDGLNSGKSSKKDWKSKTEETFWHAWSTSASFQAALTTVVGLGMVFGAGIGYLEWYKYHVLHRIERAFAPGYDPALELHTADSIQLERKEQPLIDSIVRGEHAGAYYLCIGPNGTGKGTMVLNAMRKIRADGAAVCEGHPDLEVFRLRLGKALDFDYFEDWQGSLFSRADPRAAGPALDIERVLNKLEKVALRYKRKNGRPLVLAFNDVHLFPNNPEGHAVLHQLQQRAEAWAEGGICTMLFSTDDFWCLDMMKKNASRMHVLSVYDLSSSETVTALRHLRRQALKFRYPGKAVEELAIEDDSTMRKVFNLVGGRMSLLTQVVRAEDMLEEAENMVEAEREWLLAKIGLIPEMDDDVMDEQKWSSCSWLLLRHLAKMCPSLQQDDSAFEQDFYMPSVSYADARRIMTRTDFLDPLDAYQIVAVDLHHKVRIDSMMLLRAAQRTVAEEGFDDMLDQTRDRVDEIEGLHRQSELTVKEPFRVTLDRVGGKTILDVVGLGGSFVPAEEEGDDDKEDGNTAKDAAEGVPVEIEDDIRLV